MDETTKRNIGVYRKQDFNSYVLWKSLPSFLKGQPKVMLEKFGITDELAVELLQIKTQGEFATKFGIKDPGTLTDWNKRMVLALYKNASKHGKAQEVRAWFEIIENN